MLQKKWVLIAVITLLAVVTSGCAPRPQLSKPAASDGAQMVAVSGECSAALVDGGTELLVSGTCSLMNGTNGIVCILNADGSTVDKRKFTKEAKDMTFDFAVTDKWPQTVYAFISFDTQQCDRQPDEVTSVYGKKFENLEGPDIIWDTKGVVAVFQSQAVEIRNQNA